MSFKKILETERRMKEIGDERAQMMSLTAMLTVVGRSEEFHKLSVERTYVFRSDMEGFEMLQN